VSDADPTRCAIQRLESTCTHLADGSCRPSAMEAQKIRADIRIIERRIENLERENHRLLTRADPGLEQMWSDVEEYQAVADQKEHGTSWRQMWEQRTVEAAIAARRTARGKPARSACEGIWYYLRALKRSAEEVQEARELALGVMKDIKQAKE